MNDVIRTQIRIPRELRDWLRDQGERNQRSMNGEIIRQLLIAKNMKAEENENPQKAA